MKHNTNTFKGLGGAEIFYQSWLPESEIKAVVQIAHGMAEHSTRYAEFAQFLNKNGIAVYANDHRGHGKTIDYGGTQGYFSEKNGWSLVLNDVKEFSAIIKKEHPDIPLFLFGHSMGSFLARTYAGLWGTTIDGLILSGTGSNPQAVLVAGSILASILPATKPSKLLDSMVFGKYNKPYQTPFQWLSRDQKKVDEYVNDPLCGFVCTGRFFFDMLYGLKMLNRKNVNNGMPSDLPILIFSGSNDPVGELTKGVKKLTQQYKSEGFINVSEKFYPEGRHEMLNDINRKEVYNDVLEWLVSLSKQLNKTDE